MQSTNGVLRSCSRTNLQYVARIIDLGRVESRPEVDEGGRKVVIISTVTVSYRGRGVFIRSSRSRRAWRLALVAGGE